VGEIMRVKNSKGKVVYHTVDTVDGCKVYNGKNKLLGYCENGVTKRKNGEIVSYSESPGLLV